MTDEIISGADILGALVMGHPYRSWWCGSGLDIEESRRLVPHQNATTMQVAISVVAASMWNLFGEEPGKVQGIAILSSSDLTKSLAIADYDDFILLP
jgi:homospermidine synthase